MYVWCGANIVHFTNDISCRYIYKKSLDLWHGLWWIVLLMYTHVVHTSMSILNCPILPGRSGDYVPVSARKELWGTLQLTYTVFRNGCLQ